MDMLEWNNEGYMHPIQALIVSYIFGINTDKLKKVVYILLKLKIKQSKSIKCIYLLHRIHCPVHLSSWDYLL